MKYLLTLLLISSAQAEPVKACFPMNYGEKITIDQRANICREKQSLEDIKKMFPAIYKDKKAAKTVVKDYVCVDIEMDLSAIKQIRGW